MAFTLEDLLPADQQPRTVQPHESVEQAIDVMCQHGYGQLPVVSTNGDFHGQVVTFESILQAIQSFSTRPGMLLVRDVAQRVRSYQADADLLQTLDDIHRDNFAIIVEKSKLKGVVTTADAAVFFREYAEDLMLIEGIEARVKDAIQALYAGDQSDLDCAIAAVTDRTAEIRKRLPRAISAYLSKAITNSRCEIDPEALMEAEKKLGLPEPVRKFESLSLNDFVDLLLRHKDAPRLTQSKDVTELRKLLQQVRDARNKLAHFRGELTPLERRSIRFASGWLENNLPLPPPEPPSQSPAIPPIPQLSNRDAELEEEVESPVGSYAPLAAHLRALPSEALSTTLSFQQIEEILKKDLPRSATEYRAWWSNDPMKPQSAAWLDEGWRTTAVSMTERRLTFVRTNDRQEAYIRFFAKLQDRLASERDFPLRKVSPQGLNWHVLASLDKSVPDSATIVASFARQKRLRVELYLDVGNRDENKLLFERLLERRGELEQVVGEPMEWERMDNRRACRIAIYTTAQILRDADIPRLLDWATKRAISLWHAFGPLFARQVPEN